jgi:hypothetical protein
MAEAGRWVDLQFDKFPHTLQAVAEYEASAVDRPEKIRDHRKATTLYSREQQCGSTGGINAALNFGNFETGIDFGFDANEFAISLKIVDTFAKCAIAHERILTTKTRRAQRRRVFYPQMNADEGR